jgi:hypothetical protein
VFGRMIQRPAQNREMEAHSMISAIGTNEVTAGRRPLVCRYPVVLQN